jgi:opacity protein-like surface antigen
MTNFIGRTTGSALLLCALAGSAVAADGLIGFQLGAGLGQANIRVDQRPGNIGLGLKENHTAWKVLLGVRPISVIGAELSYFDLGKANASFGGGTTAVNAQAQQRGAALFAVGYLPLPLPLLDIFGKVGMARTQTTLDGTQPALVCVVAGCNVFHGNSSDNKWAWGAGAQIKLPLTGLAVRAEYEQFKTPNGDPHLVTVGLIWNP